MDKVTEFLKERWWLILIVAVIAVLLVIPTKSGLPTSNYEGCNNTDPQYKSYCFTTDIKGVTRESGEKTAITVPVEFSDGTQDVIFHLSKDRGLKVGDEVFINLAEYDNRAYLFINSDSRLLFTILARVLDASQGVTAVIDLNTMTEIQTTPQNP